MIIWIHFTRVCACVCVKASVRMLLSVALLQSSKSWIALQILAIIYLLSIIMRKSNMFCKIFFKNFLFWKVFSHREFVQLVIGILAYPNSSNVNILPIYFILSFLLCNCFIKTLVVICIHDAPLTLNYVCVHFP